MEPTVAAPAQPEQDAPDTQPAVDQALAAGKVADYRAARRAERLGTPLPDVAVAELADEEPPSQAVASAPAPVISKRQQKINDYERRIAESDQRIRALETQLRQPPAAPRREEPPPETRPTEPEWKRFWAMPDAPKLVDFESVEEHTAAMAYFMAERRDQEREQRATRTVAETRHQERAVQFGERLRTAATADPEFVNAIPPAVLTARPLSGLSREELAQSTFANVVAEAALRSDDPATLLKHLHAHQDETLRIAGLPSDEWLDALARLDGRLTAGTAPARNPVPALEPSAPKPVTSAPPPAPVLGARPAAPADPMGAAVATGDFSAFRQLKRQERQAQHR